jgi:predicted RNase H-like nuclease (RuvC/YqgF family)
MEEIGKIEQKAYKKGTLNHPENIFKSPEELDPFLVNKEEAEKTEAKSLENNIHYVKLEVIEDKIKDLELNIEFFQGFLDSFEVEKKELESGTDHVVYDLNLDQESQKLEKKISELQTLITSFNIKLEEFKTRFEVRKAMLIESTGAINQMENN